MGCILPGRIAEAEFRKLRELLATICYLQMTNSLQTSLAHHRLHQTLLHELIPHIVTQNIDRLQFSAPDVARAVELHVAAIGFGF
jgi:NAD-dependent SIR2 family protein deacetylase